MKDIELISKKPIRFIRTAESRKNFPVSAKGIIVNSYPKVTIIVFTAIEHIQTIVMDISYVKKRTLLKELSILALAKNIIVYSKDIYFKLMLVE